MIIVCRVNARLTKVTREDSCHAPPPITDDENFNRLTDLLREMFQLDRGDLDFGLYRIMKLKSGEIEKFLTEELLPQVEVELEEAGQVLRQAEQEKIQTKIDEKLAAAETLNRTEEQKQEFIADELETLRKLAETTIEPTEIYADIHRFFARYYDSGDFMSLKRHMAEGKEAFLIPYNGEEVKLHWANADQYYIKTTANYQSYLFNPDLKDTRQVRFQIAAADTEKDNIKEADGKNRRFILAKDNPVCEEDGVLVVNFEHRPLTDREKNDNGKTEKTQQKNLNEAARKRILAAAKKIGANWEIALAAPAPTDANPDRTVLQKHIEKYVAGNEFDYFIHKDLGGFLTRELDFFLKNEVLVLDNVQDDADALRRALVRMKAIRSIGGKIIAFLAQLEEFQKRLWLKKKFVLQTEYCITLDRVPEGFYAEIVDNKAQVAEWKKLFTIEAVKGGKKPSAKFLKGNPFLVLDTAHFDSDFKDRLLGALSDAAVENEKTLEDTMDGLLIHGENFQALNLLQARYRGQVQCIYIDPPYNTNATPIIYKNGYKHSSWLSLMQDRLELSRNFFVTQNQHAICVAIDDTEVNSLTSVLRTSLPNYELSKVIVNHYPGSGTGRSNITRTHEYALFMTPEKQDVLRGDARSDGTRERNFRRSGNGENNYRYGRANSFYAVLVNKTTLEVVGAEPPPEVEAPYPTEPTSDGFVRVYPIGADGAERVWTLSYEGFEEARCNGNIKCSKNFTILRLYHDKESRSLLQSVWLDKKFNAVSYGTNLLTDIMGVSATFSYPKSLHTVVHSIESITHSDVDSIILDYFAGSGTSGHAVINLNREDGGSRKYILVEVGRHFDTVLLPRLKKVTYSHDWKNGKPVSRKGRTQFFKYLRIESYEDTLDGLEPIPPEDDLMSELRDRELREDYLLRYQLTHETQASATLMGGDFDKPKGYTLSVVRDGIRRDETADLAETFNYLLGLELVGRWCIDGVLVIKGIDLKGTTHLILWRNVVDMPNKKLDTWFKQNCDRFGDDIGNIYVNGDQTLNTISRQDGENWRTQSIEPTFRDLMFEGR